MPSLRWSLRRGARHSDVLCALATLVILATGSTRAFAASPLEIALRVDTTRAPQGVFHSHLTFPAKPGPLVLTYPKWIPGEHSPTGPIQQVTAMTFKASGRTIPWRRDPVEMFAFHLEVPAGASTLEADFDVLTPQEAFGPGYGEGPSATDHLLVLDWNAAVLVPQGTASDAVSYRATVQLPAGWQWDSALSTPEGARREGDAVVFAPVTLRTLIDSPLLAGDRFRTIAITTGEAPVRLSLAADEAAHLAVPEARVQQLARVVAEAQAMFGARHYRRYVWLVALTDTVDPNGLEHPESSDNRLPARLFLDDAPALSELRILPHEYVHSWNGKYRRPQGLAKPDYEQPMEGELLWIYEGLTRYLGDIVLSTRAGVRTPELTREYLAWMASALEDARPGRRWRPLADTAVAVSLLGDAPTEGTGARRPLDYYEEAALIWLEADVLIRQRSHGARSLDDFCRRFAGAPTSEPAVNPYTLDEALALLNQVEPYDWRGFFDQRVYQIQEHAPLGGLTAAGWKLVYTAEPNLFRAAREATRHTVDWTYGIGLRLKPDGTITDVVQDSPAFAAGLLPNEKVVAIDGAKWSGEALRDALAASAKRAEPMVFTVEHNERVETVSVSFHGGAMYPHLERVPETADGMAAVFTAASAR